jgi:hypothetical protein
VAALANQAVWVRNVLLDTDDWTKMVAPLTRSEVVADTLSVYVVDGLFETLDAQQELHEALPEELAFLSMPLSRVLRDLAIDTVSKVVQSDPFNSAWVGLNRFAHGAVVAALRFEGAAIDLQRGAVVLDLSEVLTTIQELLGLEDAQLPIDPEPMTVELVGGRQLALAQQGVRILDSSSLWLPFIALAIFAVALWISLWRRRTILWIGIGLAIAMAVTLIQLAVAQPIILTSISSPVMRLLADEVWNIVVRGLVVQTVSVLVAGLLVALGAVLAGPRPWAVKLRAQARERLASLR